MLSSHFLSVPLNLVSAAASVHPSDAPGTPDEDDEVLCDRNILNNTVWHGAAIQLQVDGSIRLINLLGMRFSVSPRRPVALSTFFDNRFDQSFWALWNLDGERQK